MINFPINGQLIPFNECTGLVHLNSIWKAAGALKHQAPNKWLITTPAKQYVQHATNNPDVLEAAIPQTHLNALGISSLSTVLVTQHGGTHPGTWAHLLVAIEYSGWLDVAFRFEINSFYLKHQQQAWDQIAAQLSVVELQRDQAIHTNTKLKNDASLEEYDNLLTIHEWRCLNGIENQPWPKGWSIKSVGRRCTSYSKFMKYQIGERSLAGHNKKVNSYEPLVLDMLLGGLLPKKNPFIIF